MALEEPGEGSYPLTPEEFWRPEAYDLVKPPGLVLKLLASFFPRPGPTWPFPEDHQLPSFELLQLSLSLVKYFHL